MRNALTSAFFLFTAFAASAQEYRGTFSGRVVDQKGGAIPGAKVTATETRTGTKSTSTSEPTGSYVLPFLEPGEYEISAEVRGFKRFVRQGMTLESSQHPVVDIRLEVGSVTESITVIAEVPLIVNSNASIGQVITTSEVEDYPMNGRAPEMLALLAMGVTSTGEPGPIKPFDLPGNTLSIAGTTNSNEHMLNGSPNANASAGGASAYSPPQESVTEVRASVFEADAAYGHAGGGTVNLVTKGGTNSVHGAIYDFNQVSKLAANGFFTNAAGVKRPQYNFNQFGISAGGPVLIPKVFNGKNRAFWFFAYEGLKDSTPATSPAGTSNPIYSLTLPTVAERTGDFSALLKVGSSYTIYDPATGVPSGSLVARTPFPNNIVPASRQSAVAKAYMQFFPLPTGPGRADGLQNYTVVTTDYDGYDNEMGRLDLNVGARHKVAFDFRHSNRTAPGNDYLHTIGTGSTLWRINQGGTLDDVYTISPTLILDVRANWTRFMQSHGNPSDGYDPTKLGFPSYISGNSQHLQLPYVTYTSCNPSAGSTPSYACLGYLSDDHVTNDSIQFFSSVVKIHDRQTIKIGTDVRAYRLSSFVTGNSSGYYVFNSKWTNGPYGTSTAAPLGQDMAAFLLGLATSGSYDVNTFSTANSHYFALFVQDDWRLRNNLTVNLGLRWEHETPATERYNRAVNGFDPMAVNPVSAAAAAAYASNPNSLLPASQFRALGGLTYANASNPDLYRSNSYIFNPRFGIAWTPQALGKQTVIRAGVAVFTAPVGISALNQEGFSQTTQLTATNDNYLTPASSLDNPFPSGILHASGSSLGAGTFLGQAITFRNVDGRNPYSARWNLGIQRQLPGQLVLEVAYIANHSVHLLINQQLNYIPAQYLSRQLTYDAANAKLLGGSVANPFKGLMPNSASLNGSTVAMSQLLVPYPEFPTSGVTAVATNAGSSLYNSLNVRLQKRFTHGLTLINNFIYSDWVERVSFLNDADPVPEKRVGSSSRPLREVLGATYRIPAGGGKPLDLHSRVANAVISGWAVNGSLTLQSGPVLSWGNVVYTGGPLNFNTHQPNGPSFDVTRFITDPTLQPSLNLRTFHSTFNNLRRDPTKNLDLSFLRQVSLGEKRYVQFRLEGFNVTNHVTFGAPNLTPTSTVFGLIQAQANTSRIVQSGIRVVW